MREISSNIFTGVMDKDTDPHLIGKEDYIDALNILNGYGSTPGTANNVQGTTAISYSLPAGTNTVIGAVENKQRTQLIYFVHNSNLNHLILRYTPSSATIDVIASGSVLGFETSQRIHSAAIVDGKFLYWVDGACPGETAITGNPPRKINLDKATTTGINYDYEVYAGLPGEGQFGNLRTYTFRVTNNLGTPIAGPYTIVSDGTYLNDPVGGLEWLADELDPLINATPGVATIEVCDSKLKIRMETSGQRLTLTVSASPADAILVCTNNYPLTLEEHHFDLAKRPPLCQPTVRYIADTSVGYNNVADLCAQFRVRYIYDDGEKSAWGPVSATALNTDIDGNLVLGMNAIEVDFSEDILIDPSWLTMIREVEVAWRNGNDGEFFLVKRIPVSDIGILNQKLVFYNDQLYPVVESDEAGPADLQVLKNFDWVPLVSGSVEVSSDEEGNSFLMLAANKEGYDCPDCLDMSIEQTDFTDDCLISVIGTVEVVNLAEYPSDNPSFSQPGLESEPKFGYIVVYLAGTDYYALADINEDGTGTGAFEIKNVPKGIYQLRVASPYCRFNDDYGPRFNLTNGREWQRTSAPCIDVAGSVVAESKTFERFLDLTGASGTFDLDTEVGYGAIQIQNMHVDRYAQTGGTDGVRFQGVYCIDNGGGATNDDMKVALNVELQTVQFVDDGTPVFVVCDHNGYAYYIVGSLAAPDAYPIDIVHQDFTTARYYDGWTAGDLLVYDGIFADSLVELANGLAYDKPGTEVLIVNSSSSWSADHRGQLRFEVEDANGKPLPGVLCMVPGTTGARFERTSSQGIAIITIYSDTGSNDRTVQPLVTYPPDYCYDYTITQPTLDTYELDADPDDTYTVSVVVPVPGGVAAGFSFLKTGGMYRFGVLYMDDMNRTCGAVFGAEYRIPFPTTAERFLPKTLIWNIESQPPEWATHWRLVRTREAYYQRYIQWLPDEVQYVRITQVKEAPIDTTYDASDATHILIKVNNPLDPDPNVDAVLFFQRTSEQSGYEPMDGDRLRIVTDETGFGVTADGSIIELPIVGRYVVGLDFYAVVEAQEIGFEIKPGYLVEFVTPNLVQPETYFEVGPCYDILFPGTATRAHGGDLQNQIWAIFPSKGTVGRGYVGMGDTYWRWETWSEVGSSGKRAYTEHTTIAVNRRAACSDIGRAFVENKDFGQEFFYSRIRFSQLYLPGTKINGLSSFMALDYRDVNRAWGAIQKIGFAHNVLLAFCRFKLQPVYIGKGRLLDLSGNVNVGRADQVLNIADETVADAGCFHPESIVIQDGYAYFWDVYNGVVWRYAVNGVQPITTKMVSFFRARGRERYVLAPDSNPSPAVFDRRHNMYVLTLGGVGEVTLYTLGFDEVKNGWSSRFSFTPEQYGVVGQQMLSFKNGALYLHHNSATYNNFYGVQYQSQIEFCANTMPRAVKLFWSIRILANRKWEAPTIDIPATNPDYKDGMLSRLKANKFESYEGAFFADFLRDMLDPAAVFLAIANVTTRRATALMRGRNLRGERIEITLQTEDGSLQNTIRSADVYYTISSSTNP